jgi:hypothetical protein
VGTFTFELEEQDSDIQQLEEQRLKNHDDENLLLNTDELSEHRQNYKGDPVKENPNLVRVWAHKGPSTDRHSAKYTYNTKTEQLFEGHGE